MTNWLKRAFARVTGRTIDKPANNNQPLTPVPVAKKKSSSSGGGFGFGGRSRRDSGSYGGYTETASYGTYHHTSTSSGDYSGSWGDSGSSSCGDGGGGGCGGGD